MTTDAGARGAQRETAPKLQVQCAPKSQGCAVGEHRCEALALAFFAVMHTGSLDDLTRAAVARCEAGRG